MKKILYITDSLGLPRNEPERLEDTKTWVSKLSYHLCSKQSYLQFYYTVPGLHSNKIVNDIKGKEPISVYQPDIIILQLGIVDCYPRALKELEYYIIIKIPLFRTLVHKIVKMFYSTIVKFRKITYVDRDTFKNNLFYIKKYYENSKFIVIPIAPANEKFKLKNPIVDSYIDQYNLIMREVFSDSFILDSYYNIDLSKLFIIDNHHLSEYGHDVIFESIKKKYFDVN